MGLQSTTGSTVYLSIQGGKIARRVTEPTQFSRERQIESSGKVVHEELYDSLEGFMTGLTTRDGQFGKELHIHIGDDLKYVVQLKLSSSASSSFPSRRRSRTASSGRTSSWCRRAAASSTPLQRTIPTACPR
jgi:hypothetical protein